MTFSRRPPPAALQDHRSSQSAKKKRRADEMLYCGLKQMMLVIVLKHKPKALKEAILLFMCVWAEIPRLRSLSFNAQFKIRCTFDVK